MEAPTLFSPWLLIPTILTILIALNMGFFKKNKLPVEGKTVLLTGASEGMGLAVAKQLSAKGANVVIVSRGIPKLQEALESVKAAAKNPSSQRFTYFSADVSSPSYAAALLSEVTTWNGNAAPDIVWCVAGTSTPELFLDMDMASLRNQMDVNFYGTAELSQAILREWLSPDAPVSKEPKHLIMTASVIALYPIPGYAPYAPSKWALRGLADTLSQEVLMYPQNIKIHVVYPGTILSAGYEREQNVKPEVTKVLEELDPKETPEKVAEASIRGLENGDYFVTVNWLGHLTRVGVLGGSFRNNWVFDTLGAWVVNFAWIFIQADLHGKIKAYGKKHGHPNSYKK